MSNLDKFTFHGKLYEVDTDGTLIRSLSIEDIKAGNGISVEKNEDDTVTISTDLGLSVVDGQLCATFSKEV